MKKIIIILFLLGIFLLTACSLIKKPESSQPISDGNIPIKNQLDLSNKQLKTVPSYVFNLTNLEVLDLSNNQLTGSLPAKIRQLQNLKVLNLSNNLMTGVPAEIGQLKNLQVLNLANNQLTGLPIELKNLSNLETLNISNNTYSEKDLNIIEPALPPSARIIK